jgi:hypothetical protein
MEQSVSEECKTCKLTMKNIKFLQRRRMMKDGMCFREGKNGNCINYRP